MLAIKVFVAEELQFFQHFDPRNLSNRSGFIKDLLDSCSTTQELEFCVDNHNEVIAMNQLLNGFSVAYACKHVMMLADKYQFNEALRQSLLLFDEDFEDEDLELVERYMLTCGYNLYGFDCESTAFLTDMSVVRDKMQHRILGSRICMARCDVFAESQSIINIPATFVKAMLGRPHSVSMDDLVLYVYWVQKQFSLAEAFDLLTRFVKWEHVSAYMKNCMMNSPFWGSLFPTPYNVNESEIDDFGDSINFSKQQLQKRIHYSDRRHLGMNIKCLECSVYLFKSNSPPPPHQCSGSKQILSLAGTL